MTDSLPCHVVENRRQWDEDAVNWVESGERNWAQAEPTWGMWGIHQSELSLLPDDMSGLDAIELGCGTGYISAWMARRGANVTGVDNSEAQLATARRLAAEHGLDITWIHGNAETVPRPDASFDFAISEYGAVLWCDPYVWVPEAYRLLRPGGRLVTLSTSTLAHLCMPVDGSIPATRHLERRSFGMHRFDWREAVDEPGGIEFNLMISEWFRLFTDTGFRVEDFREVQAPERGDDVNFFATADWSNDHPSEQVWLVRKR
jgi:SAM-dependent methyltransferase